MQQTSHVNFTKNRILENNNEYGLREIDLLFSSKKRIIGHHWIFFYSLCNNRHYIQLLNPPLTQLFLIDFWEFSYTHVLNLYVNKELHNFSELRIISAILGLHTLSSENLFVLPISSVIPVLCKNSYINDKKTFVSKTILLHIIINKYSDYATNKPFS